MDQKSVNAFAFGDHKDRESHSSSAGYKNSLEVRSATPTCDNSVINTDSRCANNSAHVNFDLSAKHTSVDLNLSSPPKKVKTDTIEGPGGESNNLTTFQRSLDQNQNSHDDLTVTAPAKSSEDVTNMYNETEKADSEQTITELLSGLGQESKQVCMQWEDIFNENESFETICPTRLECLLQGAKELEETLEHQKEVMRNRITAISKTLQMS